MVHGKHLVVIAAAIGLLSAAAPSDAALILQNVTGSLTVDTSPAGGFTNEFRNIAGAPEPEFIFLQDRVQGKREYVADLDNTSPGQVDLRLDYFAPTQPSPFMATWQFDFVPSSWLMNGMISTVVPGGANPGGATVDPLTNNNQTLVISLDGDLDQGESLISWIFTITAVPDTAAPEPGTLLLIGVGLLGLARTRRRR